LYGQIIFHCRYRPHFVYPFTCQWTPELLPAFGYFQQCCYEHKITNISLRPWFQFFWLCTQIKTSILRCKSNCDFLRNHNTVLSSDCTLSHSYQQDTRVSTLAIFFILGIPMGMWKHLIAILMYISLIILYF
jgi:hypothetical protein